MFLPRQVTYAIMFCKGSAARWVPQWDRPLVKRKPAGNDMQRQPGTTTSQTSDVLASVAHVKSNTVAGQRPAPAPNAESFRDRSAELEELLMQLYKDNNSFDMC